MSADYVLHILLTPADEEAYKVFQSNVLGGTWWEYVPYEEHNTRFEELADRLEALPHLTVGEVSWLKAALFDDAQAYVPNPLNRLAEIIGDTIVVIDTDLIERCRVALMVPNQTDYRMAEADEVVAFLRRYQGQKVAPITW